ncbi:MAG: nucleoside kinase [Prevotellaceae bacterium]|jgi:uridine kinase|nr:nucleoside kinase [Prevotellaceae bacterium]
MKKTVRIICKNLNPEQQENFFPIGTSLQEIYQALNIRLPHPVIAARVNYKVENLSFLVYKPKTIEFIDISTPSGMRVYSRTISMVLAKAVHDLFPAAVLRIEHPICKGYYCTVDGRDNRVEPVTVQQIDARMKQIIAEDMPIISDERPTEEVIDIFRRQNQPDKVILLETMGISYARYFRIGDFCDYYSSVLAPSTSYVSLFGLRSYKNGFLLYSPDRADPSRLPQFEEQQKMFEVFDEFVQWNRLMGLSNVGDFNRMSDSVSVYNMIKVSEALHEKKIAQIADVICRQSQCRFVMISGPSSSGKTTFSKRLSIQLIVAGLKPLIISMDNYFVNRVETPLDEYGEWDFESLHALDLDLFNSHLTALFRGEEVEMPFFNFEDGCRYFRGDTIKMEPDNVLIIEGIHALNPVLSATLPQKALFKIYVSTLTTVPLDDHNWISTTDTRLIRRMVRDYKFRNYSAQDTLSRWQSVRRGEDKWIFPYQEHADVMFNSSLIFELDVLRKHAEPILEDVPQYCEEYTEAHRLLKFLKYFRPIHDHEIPPTSLLREFLGGSSFRY